jgi:hypothetical protein
MSDMTRRSGTTFLLAGTALLCACGPDKDDEHAPATGNEQVSAEGKAQEGRISIKAPGVDLSIAAPRELAGGLRAGRESKVIYPGSTLGGVAVAASESKGQGGDTDVETRFLTADPAEKVLAWYRDPARADSFRLTRVERTRDAVLITGSLVREDHPFRIRLSQHRGGTEGRLLVHHND